jgi:hypothetical protein
MVGVNLFGGGGDIILPSGNPISPGGGKKGGGGKNGGGAPGMKPVGRNGGSIIGAGGNPFTLLGDSTRIGDGIVSIGSIIPSGEEKSNLRNILYAI